MTRAVILSAVRTPIGRYGGMFKSQSAVDLGVAALKGLLERTGLASEAVQDVILGHCYPNSEAPAIGRVVALDSGLPVTVPDARVRAPHVLSLGFPRGMPAGLIERLAAENVYVAPRLGRMRISPHVYNDEADADALVSALRRALG